ncbi:M56 family metallopeptidase [Luteimonas sp. BDR2-5]|uniref:M56 family metallopeptidase n=1 Tax=Proluteimonas luteida TaxID=2878685 RepID=UPI001E311550|nr:M56 family metallopeptidase [Luteimonas sp. BDR2-5]MCD9028018.1 M56 family metallopeptidase [Luteimonas sp. BDR2-5]
MDMLIAWWLERLAAASLQAAVLAAVVWGLCRLLPRMPAATQCWLWWLVGLQALLGLCVGPVELPWLPAPPVQMVAPAMPVAAAAMPVDGLPAPGTVAGAGASAMAWPPLLAALWAAGVLVMAWSTLRGWQATRALLRDTRPCSDVSLVQALALAGEAHGLRRVPALRLSTRIDSPQLLGSLRPTLLLPASAPLAGDELDMALTHELVHLRRGDLRWGWIPALARHLFFFHPLVHLAVREYGIAREAACDAAVIAGDRRCRHDYGRLLVRLGVAPHRPACLASASPTFLSLKRRLTMLQNTDTSPRLGAAVLLFAIAAAGVLPLRLVAAAPAVPAAAVEPAVPSPPSAPDAAAPPAVPEASAAPETPASPAAAPTSAAPAAAPAPTAPTAPAVRTELLSAAEHADIAAAADEAAQAGETFTVAPGVVTRASGATTVISDRIHVSRSPAGHAYIRTLGGNSVVMRGSGSDLTDALSSANGQSVLWFRRDDDRYLIRDAAILQRFDALFAPVTRLGDEQGGLGEQQGRLGEQQARLGREQGELGQRQARLALAAAQRALDGTPDAPATQRREQTEIAARQQALAERQRELGRQQAELGRRQGTLGERQAEAMRQVDTRVQRLFDEALADGRAQRL